MQKKLKVLYFEGAGARKENTNGVGNCRIRTAFLNNDNKKVYIEIMQSTKDTCYIDFNFYIAEDPKENNLDTEINKKVINIQYTKENIVELINKYCNCNFDTMEVLERMEEYRVHGDNNTYNLMDNHKVNPERTQARIKAYKEVEEYFKSKLNSKYSVTTLLSMDDNTMTIRCHASESQLVKAGLSEEDRVKVTQVNY